jgi:hypothetical protein
VKPVDLEYIKRLSSLTNVIPIIAKADTLDPAQTKLLKASIASELQSADIRPFLFGMTYDDLRRATEPCAPFAISSAVASDAENMDASLLMSPDYVQPLVPTELAALVDCVFQRDGIAWLRHTAAKKFIHWRNGSASSSVMTQSPPSPFSMQSSTYVRDVVSSPSSFFGSPSSSSPPHVLVPPMGATSSFALARVTDHTHHEERMAQVRLAKWASDLQRSLQNERERYEALARGERAVWLTERLGECVADGTLVPISGNNMVLVKQSNNKSRYMSAATPSANPTARTGLNPRDPLGLLEWNEKIKTRGWLVIRVLGGCGVVGGLAVWVAKSWGYDGLANWHWGWWSGAD